MFKDGDVVKIKPEWCDDEKEQYLFWLVKNANDITKRCDICLIDAPRLGHPLGFINTVGFEMIEKVKMPKKEWTVTYMVGSKVRVKVVEAETAQEARKKANVKHITGVNELKTL